MNDSNNIIRLFLCGDVMTGRGIDQILPYPSQPTLYESFVKDARDYLFLAEETNGKILYPVPMNYIWGDALSVWKQFQPTIKIINLETAITQSEDAWLNKGINYRMHPHNIAALSSAGINVCGLANNHILDWGYAGLTETLITLRNASIQFSGAGETVSEAIQPAIFEISSDKRVLVFAAGTSSSGIPPIWSATINRPGVFYLPDLTERTLAYVTNIINGYRHPTDLIVFSIHWGSNWGYDVPELSQEFSYGLIDVAKVDIIFGHSSHHPRPFEFYQGKTILYGCGDFINDYEGIQGYEEFRGDLSCMYFLDLDPLSHQLIKMTMVPMRIKNFQLQRANKMDCEWLFQTVKQKLSFNLPVTLQEDSIIIEGIHR